MALGRIMALFRARNREFLRDKAGLSWNILFPFLLVAGFGLIFNSDRGQGYQVGIFPATPAVVQGEGIEALPQGLRENPQLEWIGFDSRETALARLEAFKLDLVVAPGTAPLQYWVNRDGPRGKVAEQLLWASLVTDSLRRHQFTKNQLEGRPVRYIDWLFPGVLAMNVMFSAFFGVGYVVVRYRRNGMLKRLKVTPVTAFDYICAQMASRVVILLGSCLVVFWGCDLLFDLENRGSWAVLGLVFLAGTVCLTSLGLVLACRGTNEELTNGIINFLCWPMMFLSQVWFSIEGAPAWVHQVSGLLPLTPFVSAARKVFNQGADLGQVSQELMLLFGMGLVFLWVGSRCFSWTR